jgi:hypothetical protein
MQYQTLNDIQIHNLFYLETWFHCQFIAFEISIKQSEPQEVSGSYSSAAEGSGYVIVWHPVVLWHWRHCDPSKCWELHMQQMTEDMSFHQQC